MRELSAYGQRMVEITIGDHKVRGREIVLPMPPSENDRLELDYQGAKAMFNGYYRNSTRHKRGIFKNTTAYNRWINAARLALRRGKLSAYEAPVCVLLTVVFPDNRRRDPQNREKAFFDALTQSECVYKDDVQVALHLTEKRVIAGKSFVLAYVFALSELPQNDLAVNQDYLVKTGERIDEIEHNISAG